MSDVQTLLTRCCELGAEFIPAPDGKLTVRALTPLPEEIRQELKQHKDEILSLLTQQRESLSWPCPHCGRKAEIEGVERSLDGRRILTFWHCAPCQRWAVTPDTIRQPPVWVSKAEQ